MAKKIKTKEDVLALKIGDMIRVNEIEEKYHHEAHGLTGIIVGRSDVEIPRPFVRIRFDSIDQYLGVNEYDDIELLTEEDFKFKVGDKVRVTASIEELARISAEETFNGVGKVVKLLPESFFAEFNGTEISLNYAHAEKVVALKEGDFVALQPLRVKVIELGDDTSIIEIENGLRVYIPNDLLPRGSRYVSPRFEIGEIAIVNHLKDGANLCEIQKDDLCMNLRYGVSVNGDEMIWVQAYNLRKLSQEDKEKLLKIVKETEVKK